MKNTGVIFLMTVRGEGCNEGILSKKKLTRKYICPLAKNMINRLLTFDPKKRVTAEEALKDVWVTSEEDSGINLAPNVRKGFNSRRTLKSIVTAVAAINRLKINEQHHIEEEEEKEEAVKAAEN